MSSVHWLAREFGDKWSLPILYRLGGGPLRFLQLKRAVGPVSQRMLTRTLKKLERLGVVVRTPRTGPALQVTYELTSIGITLYEAMHLLEAWMAQHELIALKQM
jgi:DNA-binding HxlR family transcriptional regulator